jgi:hypothetical protein
VVLEAVKKHAALLEATPNRGDLIQEWAKELRLYGGAFLLDAVPEDRLFTVAEARLKARLKA